MEDRPNLAGSRATSGLGPGGGSGWPDQGQSIQSRARQAPPSIAVTAELSAAHGISMATNFLPEGELKCISVPRAGRLRQFNRNGTKRGCSDEIGDRTKASPRSEVRPHVAGLVEKRRSAADRRTPARVYRHEGEEVLLKLERQMMFRNGGAQIILNEWSASSLTPTRIISATGSAARRPGRASRVDAFAPLASGKHDSRGAVRGISTVLFPSLFVQSPQPDAMAGAHETSRCGAGPTRPARVACVARHPGPTVLPVTLRTIVRRRDNWFPSRCARLHNQCSDRFRLPGAVRSSGRRRPTRGPSFRFAAPRRSPPAQGETDTPTQLSKPSEDPRLDFVPAASATPKVRWRAESRQSGNRQLKDDAPITE